MISTPPKATKGKFFKVDVVFKNGFKYSYTCIGKMLDGMMKASDGFWTKSVKWTEITEDDHNAVRNKR